MRAMGTFWRKAVGVYWVDPDSFASSMKFFKKLKGLTQPPPVIDKSLWWSRLSRGSRRAMIARVLRLISNIPTTSPFVRSVFLEEKECDKVENRVTRILLFYCEIVFSYSPEVEGPYVVKPLYLYETQA
jgi:hypothetical protein